MPGLARGHQLAHGLQLVVDLSVDGIQFGKVKMYDTGRMFGFLVCDLVDQDVFVYQRSILDATNLIQGQDVIFELADYFLCVVNDFTSLDQWEREYFLYTKMMEIPFFKKFRMWKAFYFWKVLIRKTKSNK